MKPKHVAVLGGGTAGFMAAAHITRHFPDFKLYHIYDSRIPAIGVGEGTTPPFAAWLDETTGLSFSELQDRCRLTRKDGIRFENWGTAHGRFTHYFTPTREGSAYHISAAGIVDLLRDYVTAEQIDANVIGVESRHTSAKIAFEDGAELDVDLVFDARGFPRRLESSHSEFSCIPTNAALVRRSEHVSALTATRAVARPHGWIFIIPLTTSTAYGYIYNASINSMDEIRLDLDEFLRSEDIHAAPQEKAISFPNYCHRVFFDGAVFRIGNAAAFLEPLEATGLTFLLVQLRIATFWLLDEMLEISKTGYSEGCLSTLNHHMVDFVRESALFVSWHYARGSAYSTRFWDFARESFERELAAVSDTRFHRFLEAGARMPAELAFVEKAADLDRFNVSPSKESYGGFLDLSFAKVGYGIDYFGGEKLSSSGLEAILEHRG